MSVDDMAVYIVNLGDYVEGGVKGAWFRFPLDEEEIAERIHDMPLLKKNTLYNMYRTYMAEYQLKEDISKTKAQIMYCYGSKEMKCVKKSAQLFKELVPSCQIYEAKGYNHGYLAIYLPDEWLKVVVPFLNTKESL